MNIRCVLGFHEKFEDHISIVDSKGKSTGAMLGYVRCRRCSRHMDSRGSWRKCNALDGVCRRCAWGQSDNVGKPCLDCGYMRR